MSDDELRRLLRQEIERHLPALRAGAEEAARKALHALKGSAGLARQFDLASSLADLERRLRSGEPESREQAVVLLESSLAGASTEAARPSWPAPPPDLTVGALDAGVVDAYRAEVDDRLAAIDRALEAGPSEDGHREIVRHVHTLKGAAGAAGDTLMAWYCHGLEDALRDAGDDVAARFGELSAHRAVLGAIAHEPDATLASLRGGARPPASPSPSFSIAPPVVLAAERSIRVDGASLDRLFDHVSALGTARERFERLHRALRAEGRDVRRISADLGEAMRLIGPAKPWGAPAAAIERLDAAAARLRAVGDGVDRRVEDARQSDAVLAEHLELVRRELSRMRQIPGRDLVDRLAAVAAVEAKRAGKLLRVHEAVAVESIDRRLADKLIEPALHLVRNSVAHGIESAEQRARRDVDPIGTLSIALERSGERVVLRIADDGAGVSTDAVRHRLVALGWVSEAAAETMRREQLLEALFYPGFSMRDHVDELSGRGVGLDVVQSAIQRCGGTLHVETDAGAGFSTTISVPQELGLVPLLWVEAGATPLALVAPRALRVRRDDSGKSVSLAGCLGLAPAAPADLVVDVALGIDEGHTLPLAVERVGAIENALMRPLGVGLRAAGPFLGAVVRGDGRVHMVLNALALAARAPGRSMPPASRRRLEGGAS